MKTVKIASSLLIITFVVMVMILGKDLIQPLVIAITVWYLINTIALDLESIQIRGKKIQHSVALVLSSVIIIGALTLSVNIIINSVIELMEVLPQYQENFDEIMQKITSSVQLKNMPSLDQMIEKIDLQAVISEAGSQVTGFTGTLILVMIYILFLLSDQPSFGKKLRSFFDDEDSYQQAVKTIERVNKSVKSYITIKTGISIVTALISYVLMKIMGLDFAIFWAFLVFIFNYVPTFGALVSTILPGLFALLQFDGMLHFTVIFFGLGFMQFLVGYIVEPKMLGNSLNISKLVVIVSLTVWGVIWGVMGMILAVPITVIAMIIMVQFPQTRPFAIMLSDDGKFE